LGGRLRYFKALRLAIGHGVGHIRRYGDVAEWLKAAVC
jgi:hypothetical protein